MIQRSLVFTELIQIIVKGRSWTLTCQTRTTDSPDLTWNWTRDIITDQQHHYPSPGIGPHGRKAADSYILTMMTI